MIASLEVISELMKSTQSGRPEGRWLFYGIGNVGREDDGLGIRLIENLESLALPAHIDVQSNYQLNVEDALEISKYEVVIFVDATVETHAMAPFQVRPVVPSAEIAFSTHAMSMEAILALCDQLYGVTPKAFVLTMPGYQWDIKDELSAKALDNLRQTTEALKLFLCEL